MVIGEHEENFDRLQYDLENLRGINNKRRKMEEEMKQKLLRGLMAFKYFPTKSIESDEVIL
jgi:hypothetical protein